MSINKTVTLNPLDPEDLKKFSEYMKSLGMNVQNGAPGAGRTMTDLRNNMSEYVITAELKVIIRSKTAEEIRKEVEESL